MSYSSGRYNYRSGEPSAAEIALLPAALDPFRSGQAFPLLAGYQGERRANERSYLEQVLAERALNEQRLAMEGNDKFMGRTLEALKLDEPGAFEAALATPSTSQLFQGADANVLRRSIGQRGQATQAKLLKDVLSAAHSGEMSGNVIPNDVVGQMGNFLPERTTPQALQIARENNATQLQAAQIRAASDGGGSAGSLSFVLPGSPTTGPVTFNAPVKKYGGGDPIAALNNVMQMTNALPGNQPVFPRQGGTTSAPPSTTMAPPDEGYINPNNPDYALLTQKVQEYIRRQPPEKQTEINARSNKGQFRYRRGPGGLVVVEDKNGRPLTVYMPQASE